MYITAKNKLLNNRSSYYKFRTPWRSCDVTELMMSSLHGLPAGSVIAVPSSMTPLPICTLRVARVDWSSRLVCSGLGWGSASVLSTSGLSGSGLRRSELSGSWFGFAGVANVEASLCDAGPSLSSSWGDVASVTASRFKRRCDFCPLVSDAWIIW